MAERNFAWKRRRRQFVLPALAVLAASMIGAVAASGHIERASYFPNPAADNSVSPPAGGKVPSARSLYTALDAAPVGKTRIVCQGNAPDDSLIRKLRNRKRKVKRQLRRMHRRSAPAPRRARKRRKLRRIKRKLRRAIAVYNVELKRQPSMQRLDAQIAKARTSGYKIRPSEPAIRLSQAQADKLRDFNARLLAACRYSSIQAAVTQSRNNDRVVVMPGVYTEPKSRAAPRDDPRCDGLEEMNDRPGGGGTLQTGALSYAYQYTCPNDQNLIAIMGRVPNHPAVEQPPLDDRNGIPDAGACIRCNLQLEGSGVSADDVVVDAGRVASGNGGPLGNCVGDPAPLNKDVTIRADRADGFVLRNLTARHACEHDIYSPETDGLRMERFKTFYNGEYGVLTFTADHHLIQDCEAKGSGDAAIYPGSSADVGEQPIREGGGGNPFPPEHRPAAEGARFSTEIRRCDMHHSTAGYSGTAGNSVWLHHNDFYDNALGLTTDVFTAAGHPGFPQDSDLVEDNVFRSNNFNPYLPGSDVDPTIPVPVGTGMWIAGGNNNEVRENHFYDNWRRGAMLFAVPDALVCGPAANDNEQHGCEAGQFSTSHRNEFHGNVMGRTPGDAVKPNGNDPAEGRVDFWWDQFLGNENNCWHDNTGSAGDRASLTTEPAKSPVAGTSVAGFLPEDCASPLSTGTGGFDQETELVNCLANFEEGAPTPCDWFATPPEPTP